MGTLDEVIERMTGLPQGKRDELDKISREATKGLQWIPNPGPQTEGYFSEADVLLFGGSPGGGKSGLGIGLALNCHYRSLIVRKSFTDLEGLMDTAKKFVGTSSGFVGGSRPKYRKPGGGVIHFAGLSPDGGIGGHQGVDHDLIYIDETAQLPEAQVRLLMGWLRTDRPKQRCRVVFGSNPPLDSTGDWLIDYFAPWLDDQHPNPAQPGELRYFLPDEDGNSVECDKHATTMIGNIEVSAQSRTFIASRFTDNPFYDPKEYAKTLAGLPDEVREVLASGNFMLTRGDKPFQAIPTEWVRLAQQRWNERSPHGTPMCAIGVDASGGSEDPMVISPRYDGWFAPLIIVPGKEIPPDRAGKYAAGLVISYRRNKAIVVVDMGGGYGGPMYEQFKENEIEVVAHKGSEGSVRRTADGQLKFANKRTEVIWRFREALDPSQPGGSPIMLPPDNAMVADLTAPSYKLESAALKIESKEDVCKRLGRSTDRGDAVVMAWSAGPTYITDGDAWAMAMEQRDPRRAQHQAVMGRPNRR